MTQILQAFGGGWASVCAQVGAQASVSHKYVAMATAVVLLVTELGGAIGSAIGQLFFVTIQRHPPPLPLLLSIRSNTMFNSGFNMDPPNAQEHREVSSQCPSRRT